MRPAAWERVVDVEGPADGVREDARPADPDRGVGARGEQGARFARASFSFRVLLRPRHAVFCGVTGALDVPERDRVANFSAQSMRPVSCIRANSVRMPPIVTARPVIPSRKWA